MPSSLLNASDILAPGLLVGESNLLSFWHLPQQSLTEAELTVLHVGNCRCGATQWSVTGWTSKP